MQMHKPQLKLSGIHVVIVQTKIQIVRQKRHSKHIMYAIERFNIQRIQSNSTDFHF